MPIPTMTKRAPIHWDRKHMITCYSYGDKDDYGKAIWYDIDGNAYTLIYARLSKSYSFNPQPYYNRKIS